MLLNKNYFSIKKSRIKHGFFTRVDGFSKKQFKSLNCSIASGDNKKIVYKNQLVALNNLQLYNKKLVLINLILSLA